MFIKTLTIAAVATIAAVSAQTPAVPNHTYFTAPVGTGTSYVAGKNITFSWTATCVPPSDMTAPVPTKVPVQLVDATDGGNTVFKTEVTTIDCTQTMGNVYWTPPGDFPEVKKFALRIMLNTPQYSGNFEIINAAAPPPPPAATGTPKAAPSSGSILTPVLSGAAVIAASAAMMYL
ncbi:hypothetical protein BGZ74_010270 [Mortierella antarctica]|nr:hypothetical protein BGZ74_010270 [Mortierella antarctica]